MPPTLRPPREQGHSSGGFSVLDRHSWLRSVRAVLTCHAVTVAGVGWVWTVCDIAMLAALISNLVIWVHCGELHDSILPVVITCSLSATVCACPVAPGGTHATGKRYVAPIYLLARYLLSTARAARALGLNS